MNKSFRKSSRWSKCIHFNQIIQSHSTRRLTHFTFTPSDHEHPCFTISFRLLAFSDFKLLPEGWLWFLFVFSHLLVKFNIFSWIYGHWGFLFFFHVNCLILAFAHFSLFSVFPFLLSILEFYLYFIYLFGLLYDSNPFFNMWSDYVGFPGAASGKEPACQCRRQKWCEFDPWVRKIVVWQPTPVFLSGESHGQRNPVS